MRPKGTAIFNRWWVGISSYKTITERANSWEMDRGDQRVRKFSWLMAICLEVIELQVHGLRSWRSSRSKRKLGPMGRDSKAEPCSLVWLPGRKLVHRKQGEESVIWCCVPRWSGVIKSLLVHRAWVGADLGYVCGLGSVVEAEGGSRVGSCVFFGLPFQHSTGLCEDAGVQHLLPPRAFWLCPPSSPPASQNSSNLPHMNQFHHYIYSTREC